jgi:hypothetical protein
VDRDSPGQSDRQLGDFGTHFAILFDTPGIGFDGNRFPVASSTIGLSSFSKSITIPIEPFTYLRSKSFLMHITFAPILSSRIAHPQDNYS